MSVSNFSHHRLLPFAVVKKCTQNLRVLAKSVTVKIHANLRVKRLLVRARVKTYTRIFCVEIRHIVRNLRACKCHNARGLYCIIKVTHQLPKLSQYFLQELRNMITKPSALSTSPVQKEPLVVNYYSNYYYHILQPLWHEVGYSLQTHR